MKKTKYETRVLPRLGEIEGWVRRGMIDRDIAKRLGIAYSTFREYVKGHPDLREKMLVTKEAADIMVESSLFKMANGYEYEEVRCEYETRIDDEGNPFEVLVKKVVTKKQVLPSPQAEIFWLKNRDPERWREKVDLGIPEGSINVTFNVPRPQNEGS